MHFVVVAPLTSLAPPISNNYTVRIASHGSRDPDRSEAGRSWRRADTAAAFASRLQEETRGNKRKSQQLVDIDGGIGTPTGHQVLQIQLLLLLTLVAQADCSAGQQNGSQQASADTSPGHNVRPIIDDLGVVAQYLEMEEHTLDTSRGRERGERVTHRIPLLVVILANDFLLLKELDRMPKTHCASGQQTGN